jgi:hypothetical protein
MFISLLVDSLYFEAFVQFFRLNLKNMNQNIVRIVIKDNYIIYMLLMNS